MGKLYGLIFDVDGVIADTEAVNARASIQVFAELFDLHDVVREDFEAGLGRLLDYGVIVPRLQRLYEWSAEELGEPRLLELVRDGNPIYAWSYAERHVWRPRGVPLAGRLLERATRAHVTTLIKGVTRGASHGSVSSEAVFAA